MFDVSALADKVSYFLRTEYRDVSREKLPFDLAFNRVMDTCMVLGIYRIALKRQIGSMLGKRTRKTTPRKSADTTSRPFPSPPHLTFVVERADRAVVILCCTMMGDKLVFGRNGLGEVVHTSAMGHPPQIALVHGLAKAREIFSELDRETLRDSELEMKFPTDDLVVIIVSRKWKLVTCRGQRGAVVMQASEVVSGKPVKQNVLPKKLLAEARVVAKSYFKDTRTAELFV
jgi:hypothetical protein